jgi:CheY-like chemotaxis protein
LAFNILLVEDNLDHIFIAKEAFNETQSTTAKLHVVQDGFDALRFVNQEPPFDESPFPDIILLDLNLPRKNGWEVLREIRKVGISTPVIIFTCSTAQNDIDECYKLHANCYIVKPVGYDKYVEIFRVIQEFWLKICKLPSHC